MISESIMKLFSFQLFFCVLFYNSRVDIRYCCCTLQRCILGILFLVRIYKPLQQINEPSGVTINQLYTLGLYFMYIGGAISCSLLLMSYYENSMRLCYFQLLGLGRHIFLEIVICLILNALCIASKNVSTFQN